MYKNIFLSQITTGGKVPRLPSNKLEKVLWTDSLGKGESNYTLQNSINFVDH